MDVLSPYINALLPYVKLVAGKLSLQHAKYVIWAMMGLGSLPKMAGVMNAHAPKLPGWFWFPCGLWELAATLYLTGLVPAGHENLELGLLLSYAYLGGVFGNNVLIHFDAAKVIPSTFMCFVCFVTTAVIGHHNGINVSSQSAVATVSGLIMGLFIAAAFGPIQKPSPYKKTK